MGRIACAQLMLYGRPNSSAPDDPVALTVVVAALAVIIILAAISDAKKRRLALRMVEQWAQENGFSIESATTPVFPNGPYRRGKHVRYVVFRVTVKSPEGRLRRAWIRCGSRTRGVQDDHEMEIRWES